MLKLRLTAAASWLDLGNGVRVFVPPCSTAMLRTAEHAGFRAYAAVREVMGVQDGDALSNDQISELEGFFAQARIRSLVSRIEAWEGIAGDDDQPLPISPEALDAFAAHPALGPAFLREYDRAALEVVAEGNGSAPSGAGKARGAKRTAEAAPADAQPALAS
jgi:hypothetical protein